jgi:hypothetical protein
MKLTLATLALLVGMSSAHAAQPTPDRLYICTQFGKLAEAVMVNRQKGISLTTQIEKVAPKEAGPTRDLIASVIIAAYDAPRYHAPENQRRAAEDFRNEAEAQCLRTGG